jgi:hypothetical protein
MEHFVSAHQVIFIFLILLNSSHSFQCSYRFGFEFSGGIVQLATTTEAKQNLILPPGNVTIRVFVCDVISSCTDYIVARIFVAPVVFTLSSSNAFSIDAGKAIQSGNVDRFLLSALSAATAITAQSSSQNRNRRLNQVMSYCLFGPLGFMYMFA